MRYFKLFRTAWVTCGLFAFPFTRALGQDVRYNGVSPDVYRSLGFPWS
jgi:hypothetical protein